MAEHMGLEEDAYQNEKQTSRKRSPWGLTCLVQEAKAKEEDHGYDGHNAHLAHILIEC